jgi:mono/diheme cytochrome c family protein
MRIKAIAVFLMSAMALFTAFYWLTDPARRESEFVTQQEELLAYGEEMFGPATPENANTANCARCHGTDGTGGITPQGAQAPNLHGRALANKWKKTGGEVADLENGAPPQLNNYVNWAIRHGGIVVSGNPDSEMPAWGAEGGLTLHQIDALTALIGTWLDETLATPEEDIPDTAEAGAQVYVDKGCGSCHGADYSGVEGVFPSLLNIGNEPVIDLPTPISQLDKLQDDYAADPRAFLELWIRDSATNYNDGTATGMPVHPEGTLSESALRALITFLLTLKQ